MYYCHICGAPLEYAGRCPECAEPPVRDWMDDDKLKEETEKGDEE